jgi:hypothetical protein
MRLILIESRYDFCQHQEAYRQAERINAYF